MKDSAPDNYQLPPPWDWKRAFVAGLVLTTASSLTSATITDDATPFEGSKGSPTKAIDDGPDPFGRVFLPNAITCWDNGWTCRLQAMDACDANGLDTGPAGVTTFADSSQSCEWECLSRKNGKVVMEGSVPCVRRPSDWYLVNNVTP